jgi:hypothetical protein
MEIQRKPTISKPTLNRKVPNANSPHHNGTNGIEKPENLKLKGICKHHIEKPYVNQAQNIYAAQQKPKE